MDLTAPKSVTARVQTSWQNSRERRADTWPQSDHIVWTFPGNDRTAGDELTVEWHDGNFQSPPEVRKLIEREDYPPESALIIGSEGALLAPHSGPPQLFPSHKFKDFPRPELSPQNRYSQFVDSCMGSEPTESDFQIAGPMTETVLLGTVAVRVPDTKLQWNAEEMRFPNHPEAEPYLRRDYRSGWEVAGIA